RSPSRRRWCPPISSMKAGAWRDGKLTENAPPRTVLRHRPADRHCLRSACPRTSGENRHGGARAWSPPLLLSVRYLARWTITHRRVSLPSALSTMMRAVSPILTSSILLSPRLTRTGAVPSEYALLSLLKLVKVSSFLSASYPLMLP